MRKTAEIPEDVFFEEEKKPVARKTAKRQTVKQSKRQKVQVTIYLTEDGATRLEKARFELLSKHNLRVSKSAIAEYAVSQAAGDVDAMAKALGSEG